MKALFAKLYKGSPEELLSLLERRLIGRDKTFLVTANPEIFTLALDDEEIYRAMSSPLTIISPDGEGVVHGARKLGYKVWGKIAGIDTVDALLDIISQDHLSLYIYGSRQEVLDAMRQKLETMYSGIVIAGMRNGYDYQDDEVFADILALEPDLILVALGVPRQELAIWRHLAPFKKGLFIGCGGSIDVLSGVKKRAPAFLVKMHLEWVYRLVREPDRISRIAKTHGRFIAALRKISES